MDDKLRIRIYSIKMKYGITIKAIAASAGINYTLLSQCLSGKRQLPQKHLNNLIDAVERIEKQGEEV